MIRKCIFLLRRGGYRGGDGEWKKGIDGEVGGWIGIGFGFGKNVG